MVNVAHPKPMTAAIRGEFDVPRRDLRIDRTEFPYGDLHSQTILEQAVLDLVMYRGGEYGAPGASISALLSLIAEAESWLYELVADARDYGYTWSQIADRLASTVPAARHRYAAYTIWRRDHPLSDEP